MRKAMLAMGLLTLGSTALAKTPDATRVAALAKEAMASTGARGLAVAVIDDGKVASVQACGSPFALR